MRDYKTTAVDIHRRHLNSMGYAFKTSP